MPALGKKLQDDLSEQWFMDSLVKQLQQVIPLKFQTMEIKFAPLQTVHLSRAFKLLPAVYIGRLPCNHPSSLGKSLSFQGDRARSEQPRTKSGLRDASLGNGEIKIVGTLKCLQVVNTATSDSSLFDQMTTIYFRKQNEPKIADCIWFSGDWQKSI